MCHWNGRSFGLSDSGESALRSRSIASYVLGRPRRRGGSTRSHILVRRSAAPKTPAERLIELRQEIQNLERILAESEAARSNAEARLARYTTLGGVSFGGIAAAQIWADFVLWESLLNERGFNAIIELGTWKGGFSWWLWAQAEARAIHFETYDAVEPEAHVPQFERIDVFAEADFIKDRLRMFQPVILFCDNGNKPRELKTFGPALCPDSLVVVHDWGTEMLPENVSDEMEMVYERFCEELSSISRVFKRRTDV